MKFIYEKSIKEIVTDEDREYATKRAWEIAQGRDAIVSERVGYTVEIHYPISVTFSEKDGYLEMKAKLGTLPFDRIRRITGYLVGTLDRFNDGKQAEEHDRVKHKL